MPLPKGVYRRVYLCVVGDRFGKSEHVLCVYVALQFQIYEL